jgi:hypothetical protein
LGDVVSALNRAINSRLKHANALYKFRTIPSVGRKEDLLDLLADLGLIRDLMLKKITSIRNQFEHQDADPPSKKVCTEFVDFVWYFLRSTDSLVSTISDGVEFDPSGDGMYGGTIETGPNRHWNMAVRAWFPAELVSISPRAGWLQIDCQSFERAPDVLARMSRETVDERIRDIHELAQVKNASRRPADVYLCGTAVGPASSLKEIVRLYFSVTNL